MSDCRVVRIGRATRAIVAATALLLLACDHPKIGGGGSGSGGHPEPGAGGTIGGTAGTGGADTGAGGNGALGTGGNAAGAAGDSGSPGTAGTSGIGGDGAGTAGTSGAAGGGGSGASGAAGSGGGPGTAGMTGTAGTGGATGAGGSGTGANLIANGDFTNGITNWHTETPANAGNVNASGAYCAPAQNGTLLGWMAPAGSPLVLRPQTAYRLSYQASGQVTLHVKVGLAEQPFTADFQTDDAIGSSMQTYMHDFSTAGGDTNTGLAFTFGSVGTGMVCIDNVSLTPN